MDGPSPELGKKQSYFERHTPKQGSGVFLCSQMGKQPGHGCGISYAASSAPYENRCWQTPWYASQDCLPRTGVLLSF